VGMRDIAETLDEPVRQAFPVGAVNNHKTLIAAHN
jgi:hypothetical protein